MGLLEEHACHHVTVEIEEVVCRTSEVIQPSQSIIKLADRKFRMIVANL